MLQGKINAKARNGDYILFNLLRCLETESRVIYYIRRASKERVYL